MVSEVYLCLCLGAGPAATSLGHSAPLCHPHGFYDAWAAHGGLPPLPPSPQELLVRPKLLFPGRQFSTGPSIPLHSSAASPPPFCLKRPFLVILGPPESLHLLAMAEVWPSSLPAPQGQCSCCHCQGLSPSERSSTSPQVAPLAPGHLPPELLDSGEFQPPLQPPSPILTSGP